MRWALVLAVGCAPDDVPVEGVFREPTVLEEASVTCAPDGALEVAVRTAGWTEYAYVDAWDPVSGEHEQWKLPSVGFLRDQSCDVSAAPAPPGIRCVEGPDGLLRLPEGLVLLVRVTFEKKTCAGCAILGDPLVVDALLDADPGAEALRFELDCPFGTVEGDDPGNLADDVFFWTPGSTADCAVEPRTDRPVSVCEGGTGL